MIFHITYLSDGLKVKGYLSLPDEFVIDVSDLKKMISEFYNSPSSLPVTEITCPLHPYKQDVRLVKLPVLLYCRGGMGKFGKVKLNWVEQFSRHGYVVFAPSYRGSEDGEGKDEFGGQEQEDVLSAYHLLRSLPFIDNNRISIMGFSRGAINATLIATNHKVDSIHKLILWSGVSDLSETYKERADLRRMLKRVIGATPTSKPHLYDIRSPIKQTEQIDCPILIIHGTEDKQVCVTHGLKMFEQLKRDGAEVTFYGYPGHGHLFASTVHDHAVTSMFQWIESEPN